MFIALEGIDGVGKSTQVALLCEHLRALGWEVVRCRDPGTTALGESLRGVLLDRREVPLGGVAEMLVYMAARAQLVEEIIRPALEAGRAVVSDRYLLSNVAYQGHAHGLGPELVWEAGRIATGGLMPDRSIVLDLDPTAAAARRQGAPDRIEARGLEFQTRVREGFLAEARRDTEHVRVVDASSPPAAVHLRILEALPDRADGGPSRT